MKNFFRPSVIASLIIGIGLIILFKQTVPKKLGYSSPVRTSYDVIGTASSFATVSSTYSSNRDIVFSTHLDNLHLDIGFAPTSTNEYLMVLLEGSNDDGSTYFPLGSKVVDTDEINLYIEDSSGGVGLPIVFPGDKTSSTGTTYMAMYDQDIVADKVRISVKSSNTSTPFGTAYIRATVSSQ